MRDLTLLVHGSPVRVEAARDGSEIVVRVEGREHRVRIEPAGPSAFVLWTGARALLLHVAERGDRRFLHADGHTLECEVADPGRTRMPQGAGDLRAPMPGVVTRVTVREGEEVRPGQVLVVVEAMKMEHVVRAPRAGVVRSLHVREGEQVDGGALVAEIGPVGAAAGGTTP